MKASVQQLDSILRGEATRLPDLRTGSIPVSARPLMGLLALLGMVYGACMGSFAMTGSGNGSWLQVLASTVKVPALFLLTLFVTFPSLYVFNALVGSRLTAGSLLRLLTAAIAVMMAILASIGTIVLFFSFTTTSYPFMVLLNVLVFGISGVLGLTFLLQTLHRLSVAMSSAPPHASAERPDPGNGDGGGASLGALEPIVGHVLGPHVRTVFRIWVIVFGLVGAQMAWVLRPFVGDPDLPFAWFRPRASNFFIDVFEKIAQLFS